MELTSPLKEGGIKRILRSVAEIFSESLLLTAQFAKLKESSVFSNALWEGFLLSNTAIRGGTYDFCRSFN